MTILEEIDRTIKELKDSNQEPNCVIIRRPEGYTDEEFALLIEWMNAGCPTDEMEKGK